MYLAVVGDVCVTLHYYYLTTNNKTITFFYTIILASQWILHIPCVIIYYYLDKLYTTM
jgi:hypothetical protein